MPTFYSGYQIGSNRYGLRSGDFIDSPGFVTVEGKYNNFATTTTNPATCSVTVPAMVNGYLLVAISGNSYGYMPTTITYAGQTLTRLAFSGGTSNDSALFGIANPNTGTSNVSAVLAANGWGMYAYVLSNVNQSSPVVASAGGVGTTVTLAGPGLGGVVIANQYGVITLGTGQSLYGNTKISTSYMQSDLSVSVTNTFSVSQGYAIVSLGAA